MWEPKIKSCPESYERKVGDKLWIGLCMLSEKSKVEAYHISYHGIASASSPYASDQEMEFTKDFIKKTFGTVKVIRTGARWIGFSKVFMIEYREKFTDKQSELIEDDGSLVHKKVREGIELYKKERRFYDYMCKEL